MCVYQAHEEDTRNDKKGKKPRRPQKNKILFHTHGVHITRNKKKH